ncbi:MAG: TfoX/Sxy family protein [Chitinophagaceae bacterium]
MAVNNDYIKYITEQLSGVSPFETKKMFGGIGFFKDDVMFAMIGNNAFRLKVNESNQSDFEKYGMKPYQSDSKKKGMPYWEVPKEIIDNKKQLTLWAKKAIDVAKKIK